jgi:hypothetical protein
MKPGLIIGLCLFSQAVFADGLPVITVQPTSQIVSPGGTATLTVTATGATSYQWRFNGADISGATSSTLQIPNAQTSNSGYYMAVAKNATGWVPSQMAWLSVVSGSGGVVPLSNQANTYFQGQAVDGCSGFPISNGTARVVAGPALDQMQPVGASTPVTNGYYGKSYFTRAVPTVAPGQTVYYRVDITYTNNSSFCQGIFTQQSTVLKLTAGGDSFPTPSAYGLKFPTWPEWPEPWVIYNTPINQIRIAGESFSFTNSFWGYGDFGAPTFQWRKDGINLGSPQNFDGPVADVFYDGLAVFTITNAQPADAGLYDVVVLGNNWFVGPQTVLSIQITNGSGVFQSPRLGGANFVCDLLGAAGRNYTIQWSTNLLDWHDLITQSNATGTITFTNAPALGSAQFYRAKLLP